LTLLCEIYYAQLGKAKKTMLYNFMEESLKNRKAPHRWIQIGTISDDAQKRIKQKCGIKVSEIHIDNSAVIHAMTQEHHNLEPDDLHHVVDVINTTNDICLSDKKHKSNNVLIFKQDINDILLF
jgi:hypothetical protein